LSVQEDWPGGAGNGNTIISFDKVNHNHRFYALFCTSSAWYIVCIFKCIGTATQRYGMDLDGLLRAGKISVGLYHTAGKGTRLAPLPGAENNNKPGVKLPATIKVDGMLVPMTILEAVIKQTGCYAKSRPGRLSVFWGDQVFIPTVPVEYTVTHHVDILCSLGPMLSAEEWHDKGMDKYGLIAVSSVGAAKWRKSTIPLPSNYCQVSEKLNLLELL